MIPKSPDGPWEVYIPEAVMDQIKDLPPEQFDQVAETIGHIRQHPDSARLLVPHRVDHTNPARRAELPTVRSPLRLRAVVAQISPLTVTTFDAEWEEDITGSEDERLVAGLDFMARWLVYATLQGNRERCEEWNALASCDDPETLSSRMMGLINRAHLLAFPLALSPNTLHPYTSAVAPGHWVATEPILELTGTGDTERAASDALKHNVLAVLFNR